MPIADAGPSDGSEEITLSIVLLGPFLHIEQLSEESTPPTSTSHKTLSNIDLRSPAVLRRTCQVLLRRFGKSGFCMHLHQSSLVVSRTWLMLEIINFWFVPSPQDNKLFSTRSNLCPASTSRRCHGFEPAKATTNRSPRRLVKGPRAT